MDPLRPESSYPVADSPIAGLPIENSVVEVVDCLSDTVVSVSHLDRERSNAHGRLLLAAAAMCFLVFGVSFFQAVSTASSNKQALHEHLGEGKPAHSFRPARFASSNEAVGGIALLAGLSLSLAFLATRNRTRSQFRAESPASDAAPAFDMVSISAAGAQVRVHPTMQLSYSDGNGELSSDALCARSLATLDCYGWLSMRLPERGKLVVKEGHRAYFVAWTPRPQARVIAGRLALDSRFAAYLGAVAAAALLFVALLDALPVDESRLHGDLFSPSERYIAISSEALEDAMKKIEIGEQGASGDTALAEASEAGAKGTSGIETATAPRASMAIQKRAYRQQMTKEQVRATATHSGILGVMSSRQIFANANGLDAFASGDALQDWYGGFEGGLVGDQVGEISGSWGNDVTGMALVGTAKIGNKLPGLHYAGGNGPCTSSMPCTGTVGKPLSRVSKTPVFVIGEPSASSGLDAAIIRRYIKKQKLRITHCYEKRLLVNPELAGTLTARFSIGNNGKVIGAQASGMSDNQLQDCVAEVVANIEFPSTSGGALVNVSYPFTFQPAGS